MRWKQVEDEPKTFALIFETGDEIATVLQLFAREQRLGGSGFKAIGALSHAKLGWFNWETKKYDPACVLDEQVERLSLIGDSHGRPPKRHWLIVLKFVVWTTVTKSNKAAML